MLSFSQFLVEARKNTFSSTVYHGSNAIFKKFDRKKARVANDYFGGGIAYFTDEIPVAITYAKSMSRKTGEPIVYTVELKLNNYFDVNDEFTGQELIRLLPDDVEGFARGASMMKLGVNKFRVLSQLKNGDISLTGHQVFKGLSKGMVSSDAARQHLESLGYDGLRYNGGEHMNAQRHNVYLAYKPESIKIIKANRVIKKKKAG